MARTKATITVDRDQLSMARSLTGAGSASQTIDIALRRLIAVERLRRDIEAYARIPPTPDELMLASTTVSLDLDDDNVDYDALYEVHGA